ncbi:secreted protein, partial [Candidatus Magnetobacterium bavaricum]
MKRLQSIYLILSVALIVVLSTVSMGLGAIGAFEYERVDGKGVVTRGVGNITVLDNEAGENTIPGALKPVYCISNKYIPSFYFTMDASMKKVLLEQYSAYWSDCGVAFYACDTATGCSSTGPTPGPTPTPPPGPTPT